VKKRVIIFINGILTKPGDSRDWNYRASIVAQRDYGWNAMPVEYFCGILGRALGQQKRAAKVAELLAAYAGYEVTLVGHSNGAAVILLALQKYDPLLPFPDIKAIHLVNGACEADFDRNGLNEFLKDGRVDKVCVYRGGKDWALRLASSWPGRLLGYGVLGLTGPRNVAYEIRDSVGELLWPDYGHSDCWSEINFPQTVKHFFEVH
jgi:pimeloyl-ACP methyl ester carboxylesterase